jgi:dipeptidyl aminopeptidase/acylaminoacyl peptidase
MFVDTGFILVDPNVRGSDGYGKTWLHADDGARRLQIITDIEDAALWARKRFGGGKIGVYGASYGGYSSLIGMPCSRAPSTRAWRWWASPTWSPS